MNKNQICSIILPSHQPGEWQYIQAKLRKVLTTPFYFLLYFFIMLFYLSINFDFLLPHFLPFDRVYTNQYNFPLVDKYPPNNHLQRKSIHTKDLNWKIGSLNAFAVMLSVSLYVYSLDGKRRKGT
jgi:hypothetical protein